MVRIIRWVMIFIARIFPWLLRALGAAIMLIFTTIASLWKGVLYSANTIANEWGSKAHEAGVPTEYDRYQYWALYAVAVATIFLGWVIFSFATVTIIKMLFFEGLTMGTLIIGKQVSGKTSFLARHLVNSFKTYSDRAIFVLDWSGSITDSILTLVLQEPWETKEKLLRRVVYDELGNSDWVVPLPEFSHVYGSSIDEQIDRVRTNWVKLVDFLTREATVLGGVAIKGLAPAIMRVITSIGENPWDTWQITEFGRFIDDPTLIAKVLRKYGGKIPQRTKEFLIKRLVNIKTVEEELRTYALAEILSAIESQVAQPRLGYNRPGWTPRVAIKKGLMVIVNGANLINHRNAQH